MFLSVNFSVHSNHWCPTPSQRLFALSLSDVVFTMLINVKMPTIVGILTFMSRINFVLSWKKLCNLRAWTNQPNSNSTSRRSSYMYPYIHVLCLHMHRRIQRGCWNTGYRTLPTPPPMENHKLLYVSLEILIRVREWSVRPSVKYVDDLKKWGVGPPHSDGIFRIRS